MKAVAGVYRSRPEAEQAVIAAQSAGIPTDKIIVLTPAHIRRRGVSSRLLEGEQPSRITNRPGEMESPGDFAGMPSFETVIPGVGVATAVGLLGAALLVTASEAAEKFADARFDDPTIEGLLEAEVFLYEDVLRHGGSVVIVIADEVAADHLQVLVDSNRAELIEHTRNRWWSDLRGAEQAHYATLNRSFAQDEKFYRMGFEAALHARTRCKEYDQVMGEMSAKLENVQRQYPNARIEEPFTRGYERGRNYYQGLCNQCTAAS